MSSPDPDTRFLPERELPGDGRLYFPRDGAGERPFEPLTVAVLSVRRDRTRSALLVGAVALTVVAVAVLAVWLLRPSPAPAGPSGIDAAAPVTRSADPEDEARLMRLLPPGYPAGSCEPVAPPKDTLAQVHCAGSSDPAGPPGASYTLVSDKAALAAAFDEIVAGSATVICPGDIQSPGPWRRNATPDAISGMLFCGTRDGSPTVVWTDEAKLVIGVVQSSPRGPTLPQLYAWWSTHS